MLDVNASVHFIDFEGRSDGEAVKKIISTIRAREARVCRVARVSASYQYWNRPYSGSWRELTYVDTSFILNMRCFTFCVLNWLCL